MHCVHTFCWPCSLPIISMPSKQTQIKHQPFALSLSLSLSPPGSKDPVSGSTQTQFWRELATKYAIIDLDWDLNPEPFVAEPFCHLNYQGFLCFCGRSGLLCCVCGGHHKRASERRASERACVVLEMQCESGRIGFLGLVACRQTQLKSVISSDRDISN